MATKSQETKPPADSAVPPGRPEDASRGWVPCGTHRLRVEGDIFEIQPNGEFTHSDLDQYFFHTERLHRQFGYFMILADISKGVSMSAEVRRRSVQWIKDLNPLSAMGVYGAALPARAVVTLAVQAIRLFSKDQYNVEFFKDEPAAREWLTRQRVLLGQQSYARQQSAGGK